MDFTPLGLAAVSSRHPRRVIAAWLVVILAAGAAIGTRLDDALTTQTDFTNEPESIEAGRLLEKRLTGPARVTEIVIVRSPTLTVDDAAYRTVVEGLQQDVSALGPGVVESVTGFYDAGNPAFVSADRRTSLIAVTMAGNFDDATSNVELLHDVTLDAKPFADFEILVAGQATAGQDFTEISERDLQTGELFGLPIALVVLLLVFGAVVAAVIPVILAILAIVTSLGVVAIMGYSFDFTFFVVNMITMMGLAVGIDYSLFVVSRFREERAQGKSKLDAIAATGGTASRAVMFSGATVVLALLGMMIIPTTVFRSLATGAILVVGTSVAAALTLLPAVLSLLGDRVNALRVPFVRHSVRDEDRRGGMWDRTSHTVMRHPAVAIALSAGLLLAAASSLFGIRTGFSGVSLLPADVQSKRAFEALAADFLGGLADPAKIVIVGPAAGLGPTIERLEVALAKDASFGPTQPAQSSEDGSLTLVSVPLRGDPNSEEASAAIRRLRSNIIPQAFAGSGARVLVGGETAIGVDFFATTRTYTPVVFVFVLALSFVLLTVVFRSLVVAAKAVAMNLLSVGAAYGMVVLVNQKGVGASLLGFQRVEVIEAWLPLFLFSILFGLSMDYHVFLLSRIRERYLEHGDNTDAVAFGVRSTAGIITGAALIMVAVFAGFAAGDLVMLQQMGFGLAVAVLFDATIVRSVLVPASMRLLGDLNWWLPRWLNWLPDMRVESAPAVESRPAAPPRSAIG